MQKEILTRDIIKRDFRAYIFHAILHSISIYFLCIVLCIALYLLIFLLKSGDKTAPIFLFLSTTIFIILILRYLFLKLRIYLLIRNDKFDIVKDKVINYEKKLRRSTSYYSIDYYIYFQLYGKYKVVPGKYYSLFKKLKTDWDGIFDTTFISDEFFLVLIKNKIVYVYNTKFFEFQEEII